MGKTVDLWVNDEDGVLRGLSKLNVEQKKGRNGEAEIL